MKVECFEEIMSTVLCLLKLLMESEEYQSMQSKGILNNTETLGDAFQAVSEVSDNWELSKI